MTKVMSGGKMVRLDETFSHGNLLFTSAAYMCMYIQVHFSLHFIMEANAMNPNLTATGLIPYCLQYRLHKNISRRESRRQKS